MSRHLSTRNISPKSMDAFLSNLANRQTDRQTNEHGQKHVPPPLSEVNNNNNIGQYRCQLTAEQGEVDSCCQCSTRTLRRTTTVEDLTSTSATPLVLLASLSRPDKHTPSTITYSLINTRTDVIKSLTWSQWTSFRTGAMIAVRLQWSTVQDPTIP